MTTSRDPSGAALWAALIARHVPALSAYSAAWWAEDLIRLARRAHRHAERCCAGEDGGYTRYDLARRCVVHDPEAEERADKRLHKAVAAWVQTLCAQAGDSGAVVAWSIEGDPRGACLRVQLAGMAELVGVCP